MKCIDCKWYAGQVNDQYGVCKRYPPIANKSQHDWCGEFTSKIEVLEQPTMLAEIKRGRKPKE